MDVAVVDYTSPDAPKLFTKSLRETGFAVLINHPIPYDIVLRLQNEWHDFFRSERKWDYLPSETEQDGYRPLEEAETAVGAEVKDIKEYYHWYPWGRQPELESASAAAVYQAGWSLAAELLTWVEANTPEEISRNFSMSVTGPSAVDKPPTRAHASLAYAGSVQIVNGAFSTGKHSASVMAFDCMVAVD